MINKIIIFNLCSCFFSYIDEVFHKCCSFKGKAVLVIHHYLSMFLLLSGLLFGYYKLCIFTIAVIILFWFIFGDCIISQWINKTFNLPLDTEFQSIIWHIRQAIQKITDIELDNWFFDLFLISILVLYNIYMIFQSEEKHSETQEESFIDYSVKQAA